MSKEKSLNYDNLHPKDFCSLPRKELLNIYNYYPKDTLNLLKELLEVYQSHPQAVTNAIDKFDKQYSTLDPENINVFNCKDLIDMIACNFPDYSGNITNDISKIHEDYSDIRNVLNLIPIQTINYTQTANNIDVLEKTISDSLFGLILYNDKYIPDDKLEKWKNSAKNYYDWALIGRYNETNNSQNQLIIEDYESCLNKKTSFILTCRIFDSFSDLYIGDSQREILFVGTQSFLTTPLILPSTEELFKLDKQNVLNYIKEYPITL